MSTAPNTLSINEQHALLKSIQIEHGTVKQLLNAIRNKCIALLMLDAGLRVGEVCNLIMSDLFFNCKPVENLVIRQEISKNKTERLIPLSSRVSTSLANLFDHMPFRSDPHISDPVFVNFCTNKALTVRQVERIINAASLKAFGRRINPHVLRHTFATKLMRITDMNTVQSLLGHKQLSSTQVYLHSNSDDKKDAIERLVCEELSETSQKT